MVSKRSTKVVLNQHVPYLGEEGDLCHVAPGYARNYLIPRKLASLCTKAALNDLKTKQQRLTKDRENRRREALGLKERISEMQLEVLAHAGENGHLFGSVTSATLVEKLAEQGLNFERRQIDVPGRTIKEVGRYQVTVKLYQDEATLAVHVVGTDGHNQPLKGNAPEEGQQDPSSLETDDPSGQAS